MRVLFVASEVAPLSKSGGLADVAGALPSALAATRALSIDVLTPCHAPLDVRGTIETRDVILPAGRFTIDLETRLDEPGRRTLLVRHPALFERRGLYGESGADYADNPIRFAVLCRLAADLATDYDLVHANDWHAALALEYLRRPDGRTAIASILTLHNVAFQCVLHPAWIDLLGLDRARFTPAGFEFYGQLNVLKAGITSADVVSTVSTRHAAELQTPELGFGLDGVFRALPQPVVGIVNGIPDSWNPRTSKALAANFDRDDLGGKRLCRAALLDELGLADIDANTPIVASVARLTSQKGIDVLIEAIRPLLARGRIAFVALGAGEERFEDALRELAATFAGRVAVRIGYDESLAQRIEAGADVFAMPSRFEPCGTNQMLSMRFGTVPVVHATGGLAETVSDAAFADGTGFVFAPCTSDALLAALERMILSFGAKTAWQELVANGMKRDFSWKGPAQRYLALYRRTLEERHDPLERR